MVRILEKLYTITRNFTIPINKPEARDASIAFNRHLNPERWITTLFSILLTSWEIFWKLFMLLIKRESLDKAIFKEGRCLMQKHKEKTPMSQGESRASHPLRRSPQKDRAVAFQHCLFSSLDSIHSELATHQNHPRNLNEALDPTLSFTRSEAGVHVSVFSLF